MAVDNGNRMWLMKNQVFFIFNYETFKRIKVLQALNCNRSYPGKPHIIPLVVQSLDSQLCILFPQLFSFHFLFLLNVFPHNLVPLSCCCLLAFLSFVFMSSWLCDYGQNMMNDAFNHKDYTKGFIALMYWPKNLSVMPSYRLFLFVLLTPNFKN